MKEIFDLANTANESQIKGEQQLKILAELAEFISAKFDEFGTDRKRKVETINDLEEKDESLTQKVDKLSSLFDRGERYSKRNCVLSHGLTEI